MSDAVFDLLTFDAFLRHWAAEKPDCLALREDSRYQSYADLENNTAKIASMLLEMGLKKGDRIAWIGKNSDLYFSLFYGAARGGIVMVPIGWRLAPAEWSYIVNDTGAKLLFTGVGFDVAPALDGQIPQVEKFRCRRSGRCSSPALHFRDHRQSKGCGTVEQKSFRASQTFRGFRPRLYKMGR
jgi:acyl-CoA synthetase (AMP-forming)/AMP-acid ligase II